MDSFSALSSSDDEEADDGREEVPPEKRSRLSDDGKDSVLSTDSVSVDALGIPVSVKHYPIHGRKSTYWRFYHTLQTPISSKNLQASNSASSAASRSARTHICLLCLEVLKEKPNRSVTSWTTATCRTLTPANAFDHLKKMHGNHPDIKSELKQREIAFDGVVTSAASMDSTVKSSQQSSGKEYFTRFSEKSIQLNMARWIIYENKPFNVINSDLFKAMFVGSMGKKFVPMSPDTFHQFLDREFNQFVSKVMQLLLKAREELFGQRFLQVVHDMWTSSGNNNVLGSCLSFVDSDFERHIIPAFLTVNNTSHCGQYNADVLKGNYLNRFQVDIGEFARFITSDTTSAARAVSNFIEGTEQVDCEMHVLNLVLLYGIGLKDNVRTEKMTGDDGIERKVQKLVTGGGAFPDGARIIKVLRDICKYFGTPQRTTRLRDIQELNHAPIGSPMLDGKTRVASCHRLLQSSILHWWGMEKYFESLSNSSDDFKTIWSAISYGDWKLIQEMEAIMKDIARYALGGSQSDTSLPSDILIFRKVATGVLHRKTFHLLPLSRHNKGITLAELERTRGKGNMVVQTSDLSAHGTICLNRMKHQIQTRFIATEEWKTYIPIYLDPRTVAFVDQIIPEALRQGVKELFTEMLASIVTAKRQAMMSNGQQVVQDSDSTSISNENTENLDEADGDNEFDFVLSNVASTNVPGNASVLDNQGLRQARAIVASWIEHCSKNIEWDKFCKPNSIDNNESTHQNSSFNNLRNRLHECDPMSWFRSVGKTLFPEVATLVRIEFAKVDSSAIQERMFSAAAAAMTNRQTQMSEGVHEKRTILFANKQFMRNICKF
jgi:hypothetical protein